MKEIRDVAVRKKIRAGIAGLRRMRRKNASWEDLREHLSPEVIRELARHPRRDLSLRSIAGRISWSALPVYMAELFARRESIPKLERLCLLEYCRNFRVHVPVERREGRGPDWAKPMPWDLPYPPVDPVLRNLRFPEPVVQAVAEDAADAFRMFCDMAGQRLSFSLLHKILSAPAPEIFRSLLTDGAIPASVVTPPDLCRYIVSRLSDACAAEMLKVWEECRPGFVGACRDEAGLNLLWYTLDNRSLSVFSPDCRTVARLLELGCDPENVHPSGLSWRYIQENPNTWLERDFSTIIRRYRKRTANPPESEASVRMTGIEFPRNDLTRSSMRATPKDPLCPGVLEELRAALDFDRCIRTDGDGQRHFDASRLRRLDARIPDDPHGRSLRVLQSGFLLYSPKIRRQYCRLDLPGSRSLRYFEPEKPESYGMMELYRDAIRRDDWAGVLKLRSGDPQGWPTGLVTDIFTLGGEEVRDGAMNDCEDLFRAWPLPELVLLAAARFDGAQAADLLGRLECRGLKSACWQAVDPFGSTPFWYALFNPRSGILTPGSKLFQALTRIHSFWQRWPNDFSVCVTDVAALLGAKVMRNGFRYDR